MKILEKGVMVQPGDDPSVLRKMIEPGGERFLFKGDVPGHEFHGNQWGEGGSGSGGKSDAEHVSRLEGAARDAQSRGNTGAAKEWSNNAKNLKGNDETLKQDARMASMSIQDKGSEKPSKGQDAVTNMVARNALSQGGAMNSRTGEIKSSLGRKTFEAVASHIRDNVPEGQRRAVAEQAARHLAASNSLFNSQRFINAALGLGSRSSGRLGHTKETARQIREAAGNQQGISRDDPRADFYYGKE